ncbi:hypothetical protein F1728_00410 [Gimesia benthica]|uniref:Uncharacterized protein n=1 Tax=Gimesia benthica TaxID=2608982 RepID=A0A6I6A4H2_9PLAN|nr:hypothetical protein [Gimesia benthica]QGQ21254.1 hypothetical protein F1728_00410 [Gimesia benthica]
MNYFPIIVWFTGINTGHLGWQDLLYYVITPWLILGAYCFATGSPPVKIGQYPVLNQELTEQRDHIVHVWIHETHPDW